MSTAQHPAPNQITQARHPWRAATRSVIEFLIPAAALAPEIYRQATQHDPRSATGLAAAVLTGSVFITRVLADPRVEALLRSSKLTSWLAAAPSAE